MARPSLPMTLISSNRSAIPALRSWRVTRTSCRPAIGGTLTDQQIQDLIELMKSLK